MAIQQTELIPNSHGRVSQGLGNISELKKYVVTSDWEPTDTKIHVSDVTSLIQRLGGAELYGTQDKLEIVIRELIQNTSDAITARQAIAETNFDEKVLYV